MEITLFKQDVVSLAKTDNFNFLTITGNNTLIYSTLNKCASGLVVQFGMNA
jgi:hypothetical protein